jgi:hypothetical protein
MIKMSRGTLAGAWLALAVLPAAAGETGRPTLLVPGAGQTLRAGSEVTIQWSAALTPCARQFLGEQEINLSVDGGRTFPYRITPRLTYGDRSFVWRVPNLPAAEAVLDLRFGCENQPGECEPYRTVADASNPQLQSRFRIVGSREEFVGAPLLEAPAQAYAGDPVRLKWSARVDNLDHYEVLTSTDRGGMFEAIGTTHEPTFDWTVPAVRCAYFFKVVAVRADGSRLESIVDTTQMVFVNQVPRTQTNGGGNP